MLTGALVIETAVTKVCPFSVVSRIDATQ